MTDEKKVYKQPEVTKVEFDFSDRITVSGPCGIIGEKPNGELIITPEV